MEIDKVFDMIDVNLLIFLLTTLVAFISWLIKGIIEAPLKSAKSTFEKYFQNRIEVLTELKNRLSLILYLLNGDEESNKKGIDKFKEEIQNILLSNGKSAYISKDILDYTLNISVIPENDTNKIKTTIGKIDEELFSAISKVNDELDFHRKFSNYSPIKRLLGLILLSSQYIVVLTFTITLAYFLLNYFFSNGILIKIGVIVFCAIILWLISLWLSNRLNIYGSISKAIQKRKKSISTEAKKFLKDTSFLLGSKVSEENFIKKFGHIDFAKLWTQTKDSDVLGIIGDGHHRLKINIRHISQVKEKHNEYLVYGISTVNEQDTPFTGTIELININLYDKLYYGIDDKYNGRIHKQGLLIAKYQFAQTGGERGCGIFKGELYTKWYCKKDGVPKYDDLHSHADNYFNNAYVGTFTAIDDPFPQKCNWGDFRVPLANKDFDIGEGDFKVSEKYIDNGWHEVRNDKY